MNPVMLVPFCRRLLLDANDDDMQGLPTDGTSKLKILDTVSATVSSEDIQQWNTEEWLQSDVCEMGFQHMTDIVNPATKQKREEKGGRDQSEIHTAVRRTVSTSQNKWSLQTISQNNISCVRKLKQFVKFSECIKQNILDYLYFFYYSCAFSRSLAWINESLL
jgi:hypothetical protein